MMNFQIISPEESEITSCYVVNKQLPYGTSSIFEEFFFHLHGTKNNKEESVQHKNPIKM